MAALLGMLFGSLLDPLRIIVVLGIILSSRSKWVIPVAVLSSAVVIETVLTSFQPLRTWGQGLPLGIIASGILAFLMFYVRGKAWKQKSLKAESAQA